MTFEEFFKKKKIDLAHLQNGEPALFMEFKNHYEQMGEKSFDHTKKYWFNQLRHQFPLAPEIKVEKLVIENQLAEQTIADTLTEPATPPPSVGFKPRFKAGMASKPAEEKATEPAAPVEDKPIEPAAATPSVGFKPRFKASTATKAAEEKIASSVPPEDKPAETATPAPTVGFKPRFKASMVTKPAEEKTAKPTTPIEDKPVEAATPAPPVGFKPRFKASMVTKPAEEKAKEPTPPIEDKPAVVTNPEAKEDTKEEKPAEETAPKPVGFKPRFNAAKMAKPKEPGEE